LHVAEPDEEPRECTALEGVRCLECGAMYAKPSGGGVVTENPGCPQCGYLGWVPLRELASEPSSSGER
jgi:hypothetical protein